MDFKIKFLLVACLAFLISPAHSGEIGAIKSAATNAVSDIAAIIPRVMRAKGTAVVRAAADIASIMATGVGLKVRALARASSSITDAVSDGFNAVGDSISKAGDSIIAAKLGIDSRNTKTVVETPVEEIVEEIKVKTPIVVEEFIAKRPTVIEEEIVAVPCDEEYIEVPVQPFPISSVQVRVLPPRRPVFRPSVWDRLRNAAQMKANRVSNVFGLRNGPSRSNVVYEIVHTPRVHQGPLIDTFRIEKK